MLEGEKWYLPKLSCDVECQSSQRRSSVQGPQAYISHLIISKEDMKHQPTGKKLKAICLWTMGFISCFLLVAMGLIQSLKNTG